MRDFVLSLILHRIDPQWNVGWSTWLFAPISRQLFRLVMADRDNFIWLQAGVTAKGILFNQMRLPAEGGGRGSDKNVWKKLGPTVLASFLASFVGFFEAFPIALARCTLPCPPSPPPPAT